MKTVDYIIVGCGLAGIAFCEELRFKQKTFLVFDNESQQSSTVAAGLYNPVILKRFSQVWNAASQLELALPKYHDLEKRLKVQLDYKLPVYRRFTSVEEQNEWFIASDKPVLSNFLSTKLIKNANACIDAEFGFGEVLNSGRINTPLLVKSYKEYLRKENALLQEAFQYDLLEHSADGITYNEIKAKHIVFAEGFGLTKNPYFNTLPLNGSKGEMLTIKAPELQIDFILKSSVFVVPLENNLFWVGATYEWDDKSYQITSRAKTELVAKVKQIIKCDFEVIHQVAGIRPTTKDRRPLVGVHNTYKNMYVLNGLGTRGVMISPYVAQQLVNHIENGTALDSEIDIKRFKVTEKI
ncbi:FAD-binding oxidoreductase [Psychroserpens sp. SPM9]|uniref:NAD(P)/FAD-dependent oxidoreductase n=1 Tax=Psychroserpens sp. SPM9 TaxID=2975598 RepID=UPI0021A599E8|nr:FAD-dependent oxidoreductase [Psychroserpens sp. SPM9]MDG5492751.1 FAD-dependent oxidoreductase [Psychroserpens sp. SPM9]